MPKRWSSHEPTQEELNHRLRVKKALMKRHGLNEKEFMRYDAITDRRFSTWPLEIRELALQFLRRPDSGNVLSDLVATFVKGADLGRFRQLASF